MLSLSCYYTHRYAIIEFAVCMVADSYKSRKSRATGRIDVRRKIAESNYEKCCSVLRRIVIVRL